MKTKKSEKMLPPEVPPLSQVEGEIVGHRISDATAKVLDGHLEAIRLKYGSLTPHMVVLAAKPKNSPLHKFVFDRGRDDAAEAYYLGRAARLIREIYIRVLDSDGPVKVRAKVSIKTLTGRSYEPMLEVMKSPAGRDQVLAQALAELRAFRRKYANVQRLASIHEQIDRMLEEAAA